MEPEPHSASALRRKVLYVEDHPVNAMLMRALFERIPHGELVLADRASQALQRAQGLYPALLLLGLSLPDMHGRELLPLLRQVPGCEQVPAVAVTAECGFDIARSGFDELWCKPLQLLKVLERLEAYLALAAARAQPSQDALQLPPLLTPTLVVQLAAPR